jgi:hypothetical protein
LHPDAFHKLITGLILHEGAASGLITELGRAVGGVTNDENVKLANVGNLRFRRFEWRLERSAQASQLQRFRRYSDRGIAAPPICKS